MSQTIPTDTLIERLGFTETFIPDKGNVLTFIPFEASMLTRMHPILYNSYSGCRLVYLRSYSSFIISVRKISRSFYPNFSPPYDVGIKETSVAVLIITYHFRLLDRLGIESYRELAFEIYVIHCQARR